MKILLAVDDSPFSLAAADEVLTEFRPAETEVQVLSVVDTGKLLPPMDAYGVHAMFVEEVAALMEEWREEAKQAIDLAVKKLSSAGFPTKGVLLEGEVKACIDNDSLHRPTLTGDWDGLRSRLNKNGIGLRAHFVTESAANPTGGIRQAVRYTQQIDFGVDLDLGRMIDDPSATIQVTLTDRAGRNLSADAIGNQFAVQELYGAGQNFRLAELNYQQDLVARKITFHFGWSPVGDQFAALPVFCYFQNAVICGHANAMTTNSGAHNFPAAQWGAHVTVHPISEFYLSTGLYQVNPNAGDSDKGFDLSFSSTGAFVPVEFGWQPGQGPGRLPGMYAVGGYYNSSDTPDVLRDVNGLSAGLTSAPFATHNGRLGAYVMADQWVFRKDLQAPEPHLGLRTGVIAGIADRATARFRYFLSAGGVYQGTFLHRDTDFISMMIAYVRTNDRLTHYQEDLNTVSPGSVGVQTYESIFETDYNAQITPWLSVRPNVQYVINPGGTRNIPNAFVIGLYTCVTF